MYGNAQNLAALEEKTGPVLAMYRSLKSLLRPYVEDNESSKKEASGTFEFRPVGSGLQNFPAILEACKDVNAKWVVVEQDQPSMGKTPLECAETSINYLKTIY